MGKSLSGAFQMSETRNEGRRMARLPDASVGGRKSSLRVAPFETVMSVFPQETVGNSIERRKKLPASWVYSVPLGPDPDVGRRGDERALSHFPHGPAPLDRPAPNGKAVERSAHLPLHKSNRVETHATRDVPNAANFSSF